MKIYTFPIGMIAMVIPSVALAHEKWFVGNISPSVPKPELFTSWSPANVLMLVAGIVGTAVACVLHKKLHTVRPLVHLRKLLSTYEFRAPSLVRVFTGLILFLATVQRFIFAPDLQTAPLAAATQHIFLALQLLIALAFLAGVFVRITSVLGLLLYGMALVAFPLMAVMSYIHYAGIFLYLLMVHDRAIHPEKLPGFFRKYEPYALPALRIGMGLSFVIVGILYKVLTPQYALEFVRTHSIVNFMPRMGFTAFTNEYFVLAAGLTEILAGLLLVMGVLPRFLGALLVSLFTVTLGLFGLGELIGHLPLYAICFALILSGGGKKLLLFKSE